MSVMSCLFSVLLRLHRQISFQKTAAVLTWLQQRMESLTFFILLHILHAQNQAHNKSVRDINASSLKLSSVCIVSIEPDVFTPPKHHGPPSTEIINCLQDQIGHSY